MSGRFSEAATRRLKTAVDRAEARYRKEFGRNGGHLEGKARTLYNQWMKAVHRLDSHISAGAAEFLGRKKSNPRLTKAQKRANASKKSKQRRIAKALKTFLKAQNPAAKYAGAKIQRNKGSITIIPVKLPRRASR